MTALNQLDRDRLSILLAGTALGLTLSRVLEFPSRRIAVSVLGSPLGLELSTQWLMTIFVMGLVIAGAHALFKSYPHHDEMPTMTRFIPWILPGMASLVISSLLSRITRFESWFFALAVSMVLLGFIILNERRSFDTSCDVPSWIPLVATGTIYALAFALFVLIFETGNRILLSGPAILLVGALSSARLYWQIGASTDRIAIYAATSGLMMSQVLWVLNYARIEVMPAGFSLLLVYYAITAILQGALQGTLDRRTLFEIGGLSAFGLLVVLFLL